MLTIDGSFGEGGGQILRTSLSLSALTGQPFTIENIRAKRAKPGLRPQHLKSVEAVAAITGADVSGAHLQSTKLSFHPGRIRSGEYRFEIGSAGSTILVLQTVLLPLSFAEGSSRLLISGGTHNRWAPCYHYLELHWLPFLKRLGFDADVNMTRAGFYPKGGGEIQAEIRPVQHVSGLQLLKRGQLKKIRGISAFANLHKSVAERQERQARKQLAQAQREAELEIVNMPAHGKNTMMLLLGEFEHSQCCYFSLGALGKPAEKVAAEAVRDFLGFLTTDGVFDEYLADQLLLPLALAKEEAEFRTAKVTQHLVTNVEVIKTFLPFSIEITDQLGGEAIVRLRPGCMT